MNNVRLLYLPLVAALLLSCSNRKEDNIVSTATLLGEMVDMGRLTILPSANYSTIQYSSYDRRSISPSDSCWFSNEDGFGNEPVPGFSEVIREPDSSGTGEYLICDIRKQPIPKRKPQSVNTIRGPSLSVSPPMTIPNKPSISIEREKAPDVIALVQPNSFKTGLKKTPNENRKLYIARTIKKEATTTM